jgi:hypothetical protein
MSINLQKLLHEIRRKIVRSLTSVTQRVTVLEDDAVNPVREQLQ